MLHRRQVIVAGLAALIALGGCTTTPEPPPETRTPPAKQPANGELKVAEQGFTVLRQDSGTYQVSFAAILHNTSTTDAAVGGSITVNWYDANGTKLKSDDIFAMRTVLPTLPGERTVASGTILVTGAPARMEAVPEATWLPAEELPGTGALTAKNVVLKHDAHRPANSWVTFTVATDLVEPTDAFGAIVFRDAAGALIGGTASPLGNLPGARDTGKYRIDVATDEIPDGTLDANTEVVISAKPR